MSVVLIAVPVAMLYPVFASATVEDSARRLADSRPAWPADILGGSVRPDVHRLRRVVTCGRRLADNTLVSQRNDLVFALTTAIAYTRPFP